MAQFRKPASELKPILGPGHFVARTTVGSCSIGAASRVVEEAKQGGTRPSVQPRPDLDEGHPGFPLDQHDSPPSPSFSPFPDSTVGRTRASCPPSMPCRRLSRACKRLRDNIASHSMLARRCSSVAAAATTTVAAAASLARIFIAAEATRRVTALTAARSTKGRRGRP